MLIAVLCAVAAHPTTIKTVYRITPRNYTGTTDLDTGDAAGDAFFGLYELQAPIDCTGKASRNSGLLCKNEPILQIPGFNVYEQFQIEIDQRTGDYAECNPGSTPPHDFSCTHFQHASSCWYNDKDHPEWATEFADACSKSECTCDVIESKAVGAENVGTTFSHFNSFNKTYPAVCKADHFSQFMGYVPKGIPLGKSSTESEGGCCGLCNKYGKLCKGYGYTYATQQCQLFGLILTFTPTPGTSLGFIESGGTNFSRQLGQQTAALAKSLNGTWYSTQAAGECGPGQTVGDGCYWRVVNMTSNVNSSCVNDNLVKAAVAYNQSCWSGCPQPTNMSSPCWVKCLFDVVAGNTDSGQKPMPPHLIVSAFEASFDSSSLNGCPQVPPCPAPCHPTVHAGAVFGTRRPDQLQPRHRGVPHSRLHLK